jgi:hypothetical protein
MVVGLTVGRLVACLQLCQLTGIPAVPHEASIDAPAVLTQPGPWPGFELKVRSCRAALPVVLVSVIDTHRSLSFCLAHLSSATCWHKRALTAHVLNAGRPQGGHC